MARAWLGLGVVVGLVAFPAHSNGQQIVIGGDTSTLSRPAPPTGTSLVIGRVVEAESNRPIGGAFIYAGLTGAAGGYEPVVTDDEGRFVLRDLAAGDLSIRAMKAGYVEGAYGRRWPDTANLTGRPLAIGKDEHISDVEIRLWKFAVVSGQVVDETGEPVIGVTVRALPRKIAAGRAQFTSDFGAVTARTDDRGMYRLASLVPGDYVVVIPVVSSSVPTVRPNLTPSSADEYAASSSYLTTWMSGSSGGLIGGSLDVGDESFSLLDPTRLGISRSTPTFAGLAPDGRLLVYETQFYPGVASLSSATVLTFKSGEERAGVNFQMRPVPSVTLSGTLMGPAGPSPNTAIRLVHADTSMLSTDPEISITLTQADGRFKFLGVTPGTYSIKALRAPRPRSAASDLASSTTISTSVASGNSVISFGGVSSALPTEPTLWGETPVTIGDRDVSNVAVVMRVGARISGHIEFADPVQQPPFSRVSISLERADGQRPANYSVSTAPVDATGKFATYGQTPGKYFIRVSSTPPGWFFTSAQSGGRDISMTPLELGTDNVDDVVVLLTANPLAEVSGTVVDGRGQPPQAALVFLFPADRQLWSTTGLSPRNFRTVEVSGAGKYSIGELPAGEYLIAVSTTVGPSWRELKTLDALSRDAVRVSIAGSAKVVQALRLKTGGDDDEDVVRDHGPFVAGEQTPQTPPRDVAATPTAGSAGISGIIISDDAAKRPINRAHVTLSGAAIVNARAVITDDSGRFSFAKLPAGRYTLSATKPGYLTASYGATRPGASGISIALTDAQTIDSLTIPLPRGAVVAGTVRDDKGQPAVGVGIQLFQPRVVNGDRRLMQVALSSDATDDRGMYRIFGLDPGEYYITASPRIGSGSAHQTTPTDVQDAQRIIARGRGAGAAPTQATSTIPSAVQRTTGMYAPVFYPGTTSQASAEIVKLAAGDEREGLDITIQLIPTVRIEGIVTNPAGPIPGALEIRLISVSPGVPGISAAIMSIFPQKPRPDGSFSFTGVASGDYVVAATIASGGRGTAPGPSVWAMADVFVRGTDVSGVTLSLQPSLTVSGKVNFTGTTLTPPADLSGVRVLLTPALSGTQVSVGQLNAVVTKDGVFTITGLMPGRFTLRATPAVNDLRAGWQLWSSTVNGHDALDEPFELRGGEPISDASITFHDRPSELSGTLQDASGRPVTDYFIIAFPSNRTQLKNLGRHVAQARPSSDGKFTLRNLLPGDYLLAAVTDIDNGEWLDPAFLDQIAPAAMKFSIAEGEKKTQDIRIK